MTLSAYKIRTGRVALGKDNSFEVRALTFPDLAAMVSNHLPTLTAVITKYQEAREDLLSRRNIGELAMMVARDFPSLAAEIISACVHGETVDDAAREKIRLFPAPVAMAALIEISRITVEEAGGLGNLLADFRQHIQSVMAAEGMSDPSPIPSE